MLNEKPAQYLHIKIQSWNGKMDAKALSHTRCLMKYLDEWISQEAVRSGHSTSQCHKNQQYQRDWSHSWLPNWRSLEEHCPSPLCTPKAAGCPKPMCQIPWATPREVRAWPRPKKGGILKAFGKRKAWIRGEEKVRPFPRARSEGRDGEGNWEWWRRKMAMTWLRWPRRPRRRCWFAGEERRRRMPTWCLLLAPWLLSSMISASRFLSS